MWSWFTGTPATPRPPALSSPSSETQNAHARCDDCEFSFFNHAGTLPFDQLDECQCAKHRAQHLERDNEA